MKLYNIYYKGGQIVGMDDDSYECTTDNPQKWLFEHNKNRMDDGNETESVDDFRVEEIDVVLFNKEGK